MKNLLRLFLKRTYALISAKITLAQAVNYILFRFSKEKTIVSYQPFRLGIFVTGKCNLSCSMCLTHSPCIPDNPYKYKGSKDMDIEKFKDILKRFPSSYHISLIGNGEPLLNPDIFQIIHYAKSKKKNVTIFTNGLILDKYTDSLFDSKLDNINVSINAINPGEYFRLTGHDQNIYQKCLENLKNLCRQKKERKSELNIFCSIIVDKNNYSSMLEMIHFAEEVGVDHVVLSHYMPSPVEPEDAKKRCLFISDVDALYLIEELSKDRYSVAVTFPRILDGNTNNRLCRDSLVSMSIDGDGNIGGCERQLLNTLNQGHYTDQNVFNNTHFQALRNKFINGSGELDGPCKTCYNNTTCNLISIPARPK